MKGKKLKIVLYGKFGQIHLTVFSEGNQTEVSARRVGLPPQMAYKQNMEGQTSLHFVSSLWTI